MSLEPGQRRALAAVYITANGRAADAWLVAETPAEAAHKIAGAIVDGEPFVELTLANGDRGAVHRWNGRPVHLRADHVTAVGPPLDDGDDDADA